MPIHDNEYQKGLIIIDNFSKKPILDFEAYTDAIVKIIKKSYPNFTIGILKLSIIIKNLEIINYNLFRNNIQI